MLLGGVVADGSESVGEAPTGAGSMVVVLMIAGESSPGSGTVGSMDAISGGMSPFLGLDEDGITSTSDGTVVNAGMSESGSRRPLTFFAPIVL
jgi:hypothetical protein